MTIALERSPITSSSSTWRLAKLSLGYCLMPITCTGIGLIAALFSLQDIQWLHTLFKKLLGIDETRAFSDNMTVQIYQFGLVVDVGIIFISTFLTIWVAQKACCRMKISDQLEQKNLFLISLILAWAWFVIFSIPVVLLMLFFVLIIVITAVGGRTLELRAER